MVKNSSRSVSVSLSGSGLLISLCWFERDSKHGQEYRVKHLEYPKTGVIESVEKALNILVCETTRAFLSNDSFHVIYTVGESENDLFDMITEAEEPEQAFISKDVLNYKDGTIAYHRIVDAKMDAIIRNASLSI